MAKVGRKNPISIFYVGPSAVVVHDIKLSYYIQTKPSPPLPPAAPYTNMGHGCKGIFSKENVGSKIENINTSIYPN